MTNDALLDPLAISRAETLGLHARFIVEGYMAGEHKSPYHGFAAEFAQHREYAPGDDTRRLDWKVLGRTDRYYIKQYEQETNYVAHILLDASESMNYGSGALTKLYYGKMIAACLAYLVLLQRDAVALTIFDAAIRDYTPRTDARESIHKLMAKLAALEANSQTNIAAVLNDMAHKVRRRGIVIIISDFFDDEAKILKAIQHLRFVGHEVIAFHLLDRYELEFPFSGEVEFEGLEAMANIHTHPAEIRKSYLREMEAFCARLRDGCERNECHYVRVDTSHALDEVLCAYLAFRQRTTSK